MPLRPPAHARRWRDLTPPLPVPLALLPCLFHSPYGPAPIFLHGPPAVRATNRTWVQEHRFEFDEAPSVEAVASQVSRLALKFNGYDKDGKVGNSGGREDEDGGNGGGLAMSRPVGVALLMAGVDQGGLPVLYHLDPSGELSEGGGEVLSLPCA